MQDFAAQLPAIDRISTLPPETPVFFIELGSDRIPQVAAGAFAAKEGFVDFPLRSMELRYIVCPATEENLKTLTPAK